MTLQILASFTSKLTGPGTGFSVPFTAELTPGAAPNGRLADFAAAIDLDLQNQLQPRLGNRVQSVGVRVYVDSVLVADLLNSQVTVSRSVDRTIQTASFQVAAPDFISKLGSPTGGALLTGTKSIDVKVAYRDENGKVTELPLITNGIAVSTPRTIDGSAVDSIEIQDAGARFANQRVTYQLPAGSSVPRNIVMRNIAQAATVTLIDLPAIPGIVNKPLDLVKADWLSAEEAIGEIAGASPVWDRAGAFSARIQAPERTRGPIKWLITEDDVLAAVNGQPVTVEVIPPADAFTAVAVRGSKQIVAEVCTEVTTRREIKNLNLWGTEILTFRQENTGSVTSLGGSGQAPLTERLVSKIVVRSTVRCKTLLAEHHRVFEYVNPNKARYFRNADGTVNTNLVAYLREDDANSPGYVAARWLWRHTEDLFATTTYDSDNWISQRTFRRRGLHHIKTHTRSRANRGISWETSPDADADSTFYDLAEGNGVTLQWQKQDTLQLVTERFQHVDGSARKIRKETFEFGRAEGFTFLYNDGEFGSASESFRLVSAQEDTWTEIGEGRFRHFVRTFGVDGKIGPSQSNNDLPPELERADFGVPVLADFPSAEEFTFAKAASRFDSQDIEASCTMSAAESHRPKNERVFSFEMAENEDEAQALCARLLIDSESPVISLSTPINGQMNEGDWIALILEPWGLVGHCQVKLATHLMPPLGPWITNLTLTMPGGSAVLPTSGLPGGDL